MSTAKKITPKKLHKPSALKELKAQKQTESISVSNKRRNTPKTSKEEKKVIEQSLKVAPKPKAKTKKSTKRAKSKTNPNGAGRKQFDGKDENNVLLKLETAFKFGTTVKRACLYAEISESSFYLYCKKNPEFREKIELWQENLGLLVDQQIYTLVASGDKEIIKFAGERRDSSRYGMKTGLMIDDAQGVLTAEHEANIVNTASNWGKAYKLIKEKKDEEN